MLCTDPHSSDWTFKSQGLFFLSNIALKLYLRAEKHIEPENVFCYTPNSNMSKELKCVPHEGP